MDGLLVAIIRSVVSAATLAALWTIRSVEYLRTKLPSNPRTDAGHRIGAAGGIPANPAPVRERFEAPEHSVQPIVTRQAPHAETALAASASRPAVHEHDDVAVAEDELDWAGSLSHAVVAGTHLAQALAMVRAGWLVPDESHLADVLIALDAMEAFQERTECAIAPLLGAMTEAQQAEFFGDFGSDFPPELPGLEVTA